MARKLVGVVTWVLIVWLILVATLPATSLASPCQGGWYNMGSWVNSFTYDDGLKKVAWTDSVTLWLSENRNTCQWVDISIRYSGYPSGVVTLKEASGTVFISFTIQYPSSFTDYNDVWLHRIGDIASVTPTPGTYPGYTVEKYDSTNSDEFIISATDTSEHTISGVFADFRLTSCGGQNCFAKTVYAQIHAGFNLYNKIIAINIPVGP
jgi:hypothetical protein